jgi:hypothetical protein
MKTIAIVEDRHDPLQVGRVRIRVLGSHSKNLADIPTHKLPWSLVVSGVSVECGDWVFCDLINDNEFVVTGVMQSTSTDVGDGKDGFADPEFSNPKNFERDQPKVTTSEYRGSEVFIAKSKRRITNVPVAQQPTLSVDDESNTTQAPWSQPNPSDVISPSYPSNKTIQNGKNVLELDSTIGSERISIFHGASGSYDEILNNGDKVSVITGDKYSIVLKDDNVYIAGDCNVTIAGDAKTLIQGSYNLEVEDDFTVNVKGDYKLKVGSDDLQEVVGDSNKTVQGMTTLNNANYTVNTDSSVIFNNADYTVNTDASVSMNVGTLTAINTPLVTQTGNVIAVGDIIAGTVSLKNHTHGGVIQGNSSTNIPNQ